MHKLFLLILLLAMPSISKAEANDIRVAISRSAASITIKGDMTISSAASEGWEMKTSRAVINSTPNALEVNNKPAPYPLTVMGKSLEVNGRYYGNFLRIHREANGSITVINHVALEDYLVGLLASEVPPDWPLEALKAQAVAARTYAIYQINAHNNGSYNYDIEATTQDQVYEGTSREDERSRLAVSETTGQIITSGGRPIKAFFHSTCGGQTESAMNVWGEKNLFSTTKDHYCEQSPYRSWSYTINRSSLAAKIRSANFPAEAIESIQLEKRQKNPRTATVVLDTGRQTLFLQANDFRKIVGYDNLKSTWFSVKIGGDSIIFTGTGYGHGVGLCQWGAKGMAESGKSYREILKFYYRGTRIVISG